MAPGTTAFAVNGPVGDYGRGLTASVMITCIVAASGGLIYGYDIGISGALFSFLKLILRWVHPFAELISTAKIAHSSL